MVCLIAAAGCSALRGTTQVITIKTSVSDADIYVNGNQVGKSPVSTEVARNRDTSIIARKQGYEPAARTIGNHFNETGALDAVGFILCLFPGIGLLTPGAWSVDDTDIMIQMFPIVDPYKQGGNADIPAKVQESPNTNAPSLQQ
ncbi:MAG: PEGA domain-containing protein [Verrucomicrobiota bacterium]